MTPTFSIDERRAWLRQYVADNPAKALHRVAEAARFHREWDPSTAEIKAARVSVGLPAKLTNAQRTAAMGITPKRARAVQRDRAARARGQGPAWRLRLIRERAIALYGHSERRP